jgi:hypothetical protein
MDLDRQLEQDIFTGRECIKEIHIHGQYGVAAAL